MISESFMHFRHRYTYVNSNFSRIVGFILISLILQVLHLCNTCLNQRLDIRHVDDTAIIVMWYYLNWTHITR